MCFYKSYNNTIDVYSKDLYTLKKDGTVKDVHLQKGSIEFFINNGLATYDNNNTSLNITEKGRSFIFEKKTIKNTFKSCYIWVAGSCAALIGIIYTLISIIEKLGLLNSLKSLLGIK